MALPVSRNETAVTGALVRSTLLNDIQDAIIAVRNGARAGTRIISPAEMMASGPWIFTAHDNVPDALRCWHAPASEAAASADSFVMVPVPLEVGQRVSGVRVMVYQNTAGVAALSAVLMRDALPTSGATLTAADVRSTENVTIAALGYQVITLTGITPTAIASGEHWFVQVNPNVDGISLMVIGAEVDYDHP